MSNPNTKAVTLPSLDELYKADDLLPQNQLVTLLNNPPKNEWLAEHPQVPGHMYIPIGRVEYLLTKIFIRWRVEVKTVQLVANSVVVTVRLHYWNPIDGTWEWQDGIGAMPIQTAKGAGAIDFQQMKTMAIQMGAPAAESLAVKDAAEKIGRIFGRDVNRDRDKVMNDASYAGLAERFVNE
ncbi:MAG TPA: hypothetical protein PLI89_13335 [Chitinophagales bacterium]|nr:hypothetical protein [Chitinophagales bacterium]